MAVFTSDFPGADLDSLDTVAGWTTDPASTTNLYVDGANNLSRTSGNVVGYHDHASADHYAQAHMIVLSYRLAVRVTNKDNCVMGEVGATSAAIYKRVAGVETNIAFVGSLSNSPGVYRLEAEGSDFSLYADGNPTAILTVSDSDNATAVGVGVSARGGGANDPWLDSWESGELGGGGNPWYYYAQQAG